MKNISQALLDKVGLVFLSMIEAWIFDGELEDPFCEFFVYKNPEFTAHESIWHEQYLLKAEMIPSFMGQHLAKKVYISWMTLNFLFI